MSEAELHLLAGVGHGFGIRDGNPPAVANWPSLFLEWLDGRGMLASPSADLQKLALLFIGGFLLSGASVTINQIIEKDLDRLMNRTMNRPLPTYRLSVAEATGFAIICASCPAPLGNFRNPKPRSMQDCTITSCISGEQGTDSIIERGEKSICTPFRAAISFPHC